MVIVISLMDSISLINDIRLFEPISTEYWLNYDVFINFDHKPYLDQLRNNLDKNTYFVHNDEIYWITFYDLEIFLTAWKIKI